MSATFATTVSGILAVLTILSPLSPVNLTVRAPVKPSLRLRTWLPVSVRSIVVTPSIALSRVTVPPAPTCLITSTLLKPAKIVEPLVGPDLLERN